MLTMLRVLPLLVRLQVRTRLQYRGAMVLMWVSEGFAMASAFGGIWLIATRFSAIGGWAWPELALMLSFHLLAYALGAAFSFVQLRDLEDQVRLGTFDTLLVKPFSPWAYLVFGGLNIGYAGHIGVGIGLLVWALGNIDVVWSPLNFLYIIGALLSAAALIAAIITMIGANSLIWVRSRHLYSIFFGFWELARYPLGIFPALIQGVLLTVIPLGFMAYVPVAVLLGKPVALLGHWAGPASLIIGPLAVVTAMGHWRYAIGRYRGAGG